MPDKRRLFRRRSAFWACVAAICLMSTAADPLMIILSFIPAAISFVYLMKSEMV